MCYSSIALRCAPSLRTFPVRSACNSCEAKEIQHDESNADQIKEVVLGIEPAAWFDTPKTSSVAGEHKINLYKNY